MAPGGLVPGRRAGNELPAERTAGRGNLRSVLPKGLFGADNAGMLPETLKRWPAGPVMRVVLVGEVLLVVGLFVAYAMWALPIPKGDVSGLRWYHVAFPVFLIAFPIAVNLLHGDRPVDSGIRLDNLRPAAREGGVALVIMAGGLLISGAILGGYHTVPLGVLAGRAGMYIGWGPVQQYLLNAFGLRRLRQAGLPDPLAVVAASGLFSLCHAPNWVLVALAWGAGVVWGTLFLRNRNLLVLGFCHALLAVLLYHVWPVDWTENLTIGGDYLNRMSR